MNVTDIDDKIIKRARQNYLYDKYVSSLKSLDQLLEDQKLVLQNFKTKSEQITDVDTKNLFDNILIKMQSAIEDLVQAVSKTNSVEIENAKNNYLIQAKDPISDWRDKLEGNSITDNSIFEALPRYWEDAFHKDMTDLNVRLFKQIIKTV